MKKDITINLQNNAQKLKKLLLFLLRNDVEYILLLFYNLVTYVPTPKGLLEILDKFS